MSVFLCFSLALLLVKGKDGYLRIIHTVWLTVPLFFAYPPPFITLFWFVEADTSVLARLSNIPVHGN